MITILFIKVKLANITSTKPTTKYEMVTNGALTFILNIYVRAGLYLQLQHDYLLGNYPVGRDDAAQLSALQILVEIGFITSPESCT